MKPLLRSSSTKRKRIAALAAIVGSFLLTLPGCLPNLRKPDSSPCLPVNFGLPETFAGASDEANSGLLGTHEFFDDPNLTTLFDQAIIGNQELKILAEDIQIANNEILRARGAYLPMLGFRSGASFSKFSTWTPAGADVTDVLTPNGRHFPNPLPDFLVAADITWQVDIWRQLRNARDAQGLRYLGTIDGRNFVVTRLVAEVAENYYKLLGLDQRLETLDRTIALQERSLVMAKAQKEGVRGTELGVQRFQAEVRKNQSEKLIIYQEIIETENRINFLCGRFPQKVIRSTPAFLDMNLHTLSLGVPSQLLQNRPDVRQAERNLQAADLDVLVARANFYPKVIITSGIGFEAFQPKYVFHTPESLIYNVAGNLVAPVINRAAIKAEYMNSNARQLQALYEYQRTVLNAFTEVVNRVTKVQNYTKSIEVKKQQLDSLETAVAVSSNLFQNARVEYVDVLFAQRDRNEAKITLIETKREQLSAIVNAYQALGGGWQMQSAVPPVEALPPIEAIPAPKEDPANKVPAKKEAAKAEPSSRKAAKDEPAKGELILPAPK